MVPSSSPVETLSTGQRVRLPLAATLDAVGGAFLADADRLRERVPPGCVPFRLAPGVGTVVLAGVSYRDVGDFEPYGEFAVIVPCVRNAPDLPLASLVTGELGGYVDFLPVTTDASVALGREIWGYPKVRAEVRFDRRDRGTTVTVERDGRTVCRLATPDWQPRGRTTTAYSYTEKDGRLLRTPIEIDGPFRVRPLDPRCVVDTGDDPYGRTLDALLFGRHSIASLVARRAGARLRPGDPVDAVDPRTE